MIYNTEDCDMIDPKHKSYVSVDMNNIVTNTIEKTVRLVYNVKQFCEKVRAESTPCSAGG